MTWDVTSLAVDRLDFVSALLSIVAIVLAIGIFPLFGWLRFRAQQVAREAAKEEVAELMERLEKDAISRIESLLPGLIQEYRTYVQDSPIDDDLANEIAGAQEVTSDDDDPRPAEGTGTSTGRRPRPGKGTGR